MIFRIFFCSFAAILACIIPLAAMHESVDSFEVSDREICSNDAVVNLTCGLRLPCLSGHVLMQWLYHAGVKRSKAEDLIQHEIMGLDLFEMNWRDMNSLAGFSAEDTLNIACFATQICSSPQHSPDGPSNSCRQKLDADAVEICYGACDDESTRQSFICPNQTPLLPCIARQTRDNQHIQKGRAMADPFPKEHHAAAARPPGAAATAAVLTAAAEAEAEAEAAAAAADLSRAFIKAECGIDAEVRRPTPARPAQVGAHERICKPF
jgi:hypothetical protein